MSEHRNVRVPVSKATRFEVFKRDRFTCQYCGAHPPAVVLHVDHIDPVALGGGNEIDNLVTACAACNLGKSATPLSVVPKSLEERAQETQEREEQIAGYAAIMEAARQRLEDDTWRVVRHMARSEIDSINRRQFDSIKLFVEKLGAHEVMEAAEVAEWRRPLRVSGSGRFNDAAFRYFCGVCWNKVRGPNNG